MENVLGIQEDARTRKALRAANTVVDERIEEVNSRSRADVQAADMQNQEEGQQGVRDRGRYHRMYWESVSEAEVRDYVFVHMMFCSRRDRVLLCLTRSSVLGLRAKSVARVSCKPSPTLSCSRGEPMRVMTLHLSDRPLFVHIAVKHLAGQALRALFRAQGCL